MPGTEIPGFDISIFFDKTTALGQAVELLIYTFIACITTTIILLIYNRFVKKKLKNKKNIQIRFTQNIIRTLIILIAVIWVLVSSTATTDIGKVLFQGTAIIGAVAGLAAQPVLGDLFSGLALSFNKPFEIGDRIELDNGIRGVVMDITPRHVVLRTIDTIDVIVPNSKINSCLITNMSHNTKIRSVHMRFNVAYGTDIDKAMKVLRDAVIESDYSEPEWKNKDYGPVYFISYADSSLVLATTVYFKPVNATEIVMSDINKRVNDAFTREGIEIPFNYVNVVMKDKD
ncbi:MAG: mechanosensitive ion channel family protein [Saccharofermentans sp.]|nr:mechanosensitive ion channel [Clostridiales bacterium]MCR5384285.1 mechanosensitive ion channel family protein [Saccharofermentans sp.]